ncbi:MAG: DUF4157 domain-containing protein [Chloroflexi bacterium]|nr:DUF4157 domain-containing protein [Chloroflexota bacterium]
MSDQAHDNELVRKTTARTPDAAPDTTPDVNPLTKLQRMIGNRAVQRLMMSNGSVIQTKLTVTAANDAYESEADAVADQVVRKVQAPQVQRADEDELQAKRDIQRAQEEDEMMMKRDIQRVQEEDELQAKRDIQRVQEEDELQAKRDIQRVQEEDELQAKRDIQRAQEEDEIQAKRIQRSSSEDMMGSFNVGGDFEKSLSSARGGGQSIDSGTRGKLEGAMGADFSNVRIHEGKQADALNNSIQAKAFTTGSDIFFRSGEYNPSSSDGQKLLAHELTHTIQQGAVNTKRDDGKS